MPEKTELVRAEIDPRELSNRHLRDLLELCFQMHEQGVLPGYEHVTARLEDAEQKNLAAEIDLHARDVGISDELIERTLAYFRRRREVGQGIPAALVGPHAAAPSGALDQPSRERLRLATELHRKRVSR